MKITLQKYIKLKEKNKMQNQIKNLTKTELRKIVTAVINKMQFITNKGVVEIQDMFTMPIGKQDGSESHSINALIAKETKSALEASFKPIGADDVTLDKSRLEVLNIIGQMILGKQEDDKRITAIKQLEKRIAEKKFENQTEDDLLKELKKLKAK